MTHGTLSLAPAWPIFPAREPDPVTIDALHQSVDGRLLVATIGVRHFVSIDGDNYCGPFKTQQAAIDYGTKAIGVAA